MEANNKTPQETYIRRCSVCQTIETPEIDFGFVKIGKTRIHPASYNAGQLNAFGYNFTDGLLSIECTKYFAELPEKVIETYRKNSVPERCY